MNDKPQCNCTPRRRFFRLPTARFWRRFLIGVVAVFLAASLMMEFFATQLAVFFPGLDIEPRGDAMGNVARALAAIFGAGL